MKIGAKPVGRPPKLEDEKLEFYDYVRLNRAQFEKVGRIAKQLGGVSRAAVFRYLLSKEEEEIT